MKNLASNLKIFIWLTLLTGVIYPLIVTACALLGMPANAKGSLITKNTLLIGSKHIAQKFESNKYFWPRPSAADYNPLSSGGSNLGPTSSLLKEAVEKRKARLCEAHQSKEVPSELLYASGSGLDPHISPACALFQLDRIVQARRIDKKVIEDLIGYHTKNRFSLLGPPYVNVLELNLALDELPLNLLEDR